MTNIPAKSELTSGANTTEGDFQGGMNKVIDFLTELAIHGQPETNNIATSGLITPTKSYVSVDTESGTALSDNLDGIERTTIGDKMVIIRPKTAARIVTMRHNQNNSGKLWLLDEEDFILRDPSYCSMLLWNDSDSRWEEISRNIPNAIPAAEQATIRSKLGLGDAANRTIGISAGQIPLIDNLGTAALVNTGVNTGQVPLANQLGSLAFLSQITDAQLNPSGVTPGTYNKFTVNAQGRVTSAETQDVVTEPFNIITFTSDGVYTPSVGVRYVEVIVTGGGGAARSNAGGTSSFGVHCSATGGQAGGNTITTNGGDGIGGDDNIKGGNGASYPVAGSTNNPYLCVGGGSYWAAAHGVYNTSVAGFEYGQGGASSTGTEGVGGGGGTAIKLILAEDLGATETITVGLGGLGGSFGGIGGGPYVAGHSGVVKIKEYF